MHALVSACPRCGREQVRKDEDGDDCSKCAHCNRLCCARCGCLWCNTDASGNRAASSTATPDSDDGRGIVAHLRDPYLQRQATHKATELTGRSYADAADAVQVAVMDAWRLETRCASALAWHRWLVTRAVHKLSRMPQAGGAGVPATQGNARAPAHVDAETMCRWAAAMCGDRGPTLCALLADALTLGEAGAELDVTRERARQLKAALAARLFARATKPLDTRKALC